MQKIAEQDQVRKSMHALQDFLDSANSLRSQGWYDEATHACKQGMELSPEATDAYVLFAQIEEEIGHLEEAIQLCRHVVDLKPDWAEAHHNLGRLLLQNGQFDQAIRSCQLAINIEPKMGIAHVHMGAALFAKGQAVKAMKFFFKAIDLHYKHPEVYFQIGVANLSEGRAEEAIKFFDKAIDLHYERPETYFQLGVAHLEEGHREKALDYFHSSLQLDARQPQVFLHQGMALSSQGRLKESIESYRKAIDLKPNSDLYCRLAGVHIEEGNFEVAAVNYRNAIEMSPDQPEAHYGLGYVQVKQHQLREALHTCQTAISLAPGWHGRHKLLRALLKEEAFIALVLEQIPDGVLRKMLQDLLKRDSVYHPSKYWLFHLLLNVTQLASGGLTNFKRSVNMNYFQWVGAEISDQYDALRSQLSDGKGFLEKTASQECGSSQEGKPPQWSPAQWERYQQFVHLCWKFAVEQDHLNISGCLSEPPIGNPMVIECEGQAISQDLCNSVLEVNEIFRHMPKRTSKTLEVGELGAGYGRIPFVILKSIPNTHVTIIDIPPALYISQWYFSRLFLEADIFKYRDFSAYEEIQEEYESSKIAFMLSSQVDLLPDDLFDLFVTVATLQEMTQPQINMWFVSIDRLCSGFFYFKQYMTSTNDIDDTCITREDYPSKASWTKLLDRPCRLQSKFFEALYQTRTRG